MEYAVASIGREFGSVYLGDKNVAMLVVSNGWAKVLSLSCVLTFEDDLCWFNRSCDSNLVHITCLNLIQVREQGQQKGEASPFLAELLRLEEIVKQEGLGKWSKVRSLFVSYLLHHCVKYKLVIV